MTMRLLKNNIVQNLTCGLQAGIQQIYTKLLYHFKLDYQETPDAPPLYKRMKQVVHVCNCAGITIHQQDLEFYNLNTSIVSSLTGYQLRRLFDFACRSHICLKSKYIKCCCNHLQYVSIWMSYSYIVLVNLPVYITKNCAYISNLNNSTIQFRCPTPIYSTQICIYQGNSNYLV